MVEPLTAARLTATGSDTAHSCGPPPHVVRAASRARLACSPGRLSNCSTRNVALGRRTAISICMGEVVSSTYSKCPKQRSGSSRYRALESSISLPLLNHPRLSPLSCRKMLGPNLPPDRCGIKCPTIRSCRKWWLLSAAALSECPVACSSSVTFAADRWTPGGADSTAVAELFVGGEGPAQGAESVLATLLHEAARGLADVRKVSGPVTSGPLPQHPLTSC